MVYLGRPYPFKFFKGCLPHFLLGPFLNILSHLIMGGKWWEKVLHETQIDGLSESLLERTFFSFGFLVVAQFFSVKPTKINFFVL